MTVRELFAMIDDLAPFDTQADFDNAGLLLGDPAQTVRGIHVALDVTDGVLDEAEAVGANVLVTHHPLMFAPRRRLTEEDYEARLLCRMIRGHMALIAAHTNLDSAPGGINDVLAAVCGLRSVTGEGYLRIGTLPGGETVGTLIPRLEAALHTTVRVMGQLPPEQTLHRMAVSSGAGSDSWEEAVRLGADVFLTGEMKHHHALALSGAGVLGLECGHFATEEPGIFALADALQKQLNAVQYEGYVSKSHQGGYAGRYGADRR